MTSGKAPASDRSKASSKPRTRQKGDARTITEARDNAPVDHQAADPDLARTEADGSDEGIGNPGADHPGGDRPQIGNLDVRDSDGAGGGFPDTNGVETGEVDAVTVEPGVAAAVGTQGTDAQGMDTQGTGATPPSPVRIEIDPRVTGGVMLDRFDVMLRARITAIPAIHSATLIADDGERSTTLFGPSPSESTVTLPDGLAAQRRTIQFNLTRPVARAADPCPCRIIVRDVNGEEYGQDLELTIDPAATPPIRISTTSMQAPDAAEPALVPAILYVERVVLSEAGHLLITGWAVSLSPVALVQVFAGSACIAARMGIEREDVAAAYQAYPDSRTCGFEIAHDLPEDLLGIDTVRVEMLCGDGLTHDVVMPVHRALPDAAPHQAEHPAPTTFGGLAQAPSYSLTTGFNLLAGPALSVLSAVAPPPEPDRSIHMFCDEAHLEGHGQLIVTGWATSAAGVARVAVLLGDEQVGVAELGHERPDVGAQHPAIPAARLSGFRFDRKITDRVEGEHHVRIVVTTGLGDERTEEAVVVATPLPPAPEPPPPAPAQTASGPEADPREMKFQLDSPTVSDGRVGDTVTGRLTVDGWVLSRSAITGIEVWMGTQRLGDAHHGLARQDVGAAFPDWPNAVRSGFAFHCPPRSLRDGAHVMRLIVRCESGYVYEQSFLIEVKRADTERDSVNIRRRLPRIGRAFLQGLLDRMEYRPAFTVILRQDGLLDTNSLRATLYSLIGQAYANWRVLLLCDDPATAEAARRIIDTTGADLRWRASVLSIADVGWTEPLAHDHGAFHLILSPGDELGVDALAELALGSGLHRDANLLYADETRTSPISGEREPFFKPDFSPDLLLSTNYIGRPWVVAGSVLVDTGASPASLRERGEYDLLLHCAERAGLIHHVPKLLCQRGADDLDTDDQSEAALRRTAKRRGIEAEVLPTAVPHAWRLRRCAPVRGKVSIIIPTCAAHGYIETCITTLREKTAYPDIEIIVIDNIPDDQVAWKIFVEQNADKVVDIPDAFNWSRFNNRAADVADGAFILFLNDDIEIERDDWLDVLLENVARPEVGIVGPRLLYPARTVQHAGMFLATNGIARHAFRFAAENDPCYFGLAMTQRNVIAVTGACMLMRRDVFEAVGRFNEAHQIVNNDLDFCLRVHQAGLLTVYTPHATLVHHELASRDKLKDVYDSSLFNSMWADRFTAGDPYFNPRLYRHADDQHPDDEPVETVFSGQPLFTPDEIRRLLVVKLDHIGDFITALPSIRRLKELFPAARITVLSGPAAQSFAAYEPAIDEFIPFEFFHVKSGMGRKEVTDDDLRELGGRLAAYRFDLAVDLRKQPDTRDVLKYSRSRYLAGFDHQAQFNYLDVALEWETDRSLHNKRNHVSDDLLNLVEAVGQASRSHQPSLTIPPEAAADALAHLPDDARRLFDKPVAIIHPGVGSAVKQWPLPYFSALIDLLVARNGLNIVLIGSPDEAELAREVLDGVTDQTAIVSLVGKTPLRELPMLLANAVLYIGNDSGPKHIAAAVGVPTIGIHSGVVDTMEWGPVGSSAIALRRNMACSPCYLARQEDCPRDLACLKGLEPTLVYEAAVAMLARPIPRQAPVPLVYPDVTARGPESAEAPVRAAAPPAAESPGAEPEPQTGTEHGGASAGAETDGAVAPQHEQEHGNMAAPARKTRRRRSAKVVA